MKSKIINMADKIKDAQDRLLESMFQAEAIADDGFSDRIVGKIQRRLWVQRLALPIAAAIGGVIAFKPAMALIAIVSQLSLSVPGEYVALATDRLPPLQLIVTGGMLLVIAVLSIRMLEE